MGLGRRLRAVRPARVRALARALVAVVVVRAGLRVLPFRWWDRIADQMPAARSARPAGASARDIARSVRRVSRYVPGATCLTQALAARMLLTRSGFASELMFGVARTAEGELRAHARLESDGVIVLGGAESGEYTPLAPVKPLIGRSSSSNGRLADFDGSRTTGAGPLDSRAVTTI